MTGKQIAINPLPWFLNGEGEWNLSQELLDSALRCVSQNEFKAVSIEIPAGMSSNEYKEFLSLHDVSPAPGYFGADFHNNEMGKEILASAATHAVRHRELGVDHTFIASNLSPERISHPARGFMSDPERNKIVSNMVRQVTQVMADEGVAACLHQHVGSWIETEDELDYVMSEVPDLKFGPDTGHLSWAGIDVVRIFDKYRDRIGGIHLKDASRTIAQEALMQNLDYFATTKIHLWQELGHGDVPLLKILETVPAEFAGWFVVEVDVPSLPTKEDSTAASADWIRDNLAIRNGHA